MKTYQITTPNGTRHWLADDADHAREQHIDAFCDAGSEKILAVEEVPAATADEIMARIEASCSEEQIATARLDIASDRADFRFGERYLPCGPYGHLDCSDREKGPCFGEAVDREMGKISAIDLADYFGIDIGIEG